MVIDFLNDVVDDVEPVVDLLPNDDLVSKSVMLELLVWFMGSSFKNEMLQAVVLPLKKFIGVCFWRFLLWQKTSRDVVRVYCRGWAG